MRLDSIQGRLGLLFLAFVVLVSISASATFWGIASQQSDAMLINLAGRQRMLIQQMTRLAVVNPPADPVTVPPDQDAANASATFAQTLEALERGGTAEHTSGKTVQIPPARDPETLAALSQVRQTWGKFKPTLEQLLLTPADDPDRSILIESLETDASNLVVQADAVVQALETASVRKLNRLRAVQIGFLAGALGLLFAAGWLTNRDLINPLRSLSREAERIGAGNLTTPVPGRGPAEVQVLTESFEAMRGQLKSSRAELLSWAEALESRVEMRTHELEALYEVSREISSRLDVNHVLNSVVTKARDLLKAETAFLCLVDESGSLLEISAHNGPQDAVMGQVTSYQGNLTSRVLAGSRAMICADSRCTGGCAILAPPYRVSHLAAPLRVRERVIGALCVGDHRPDAFLPEDLDVLTKLANSAAIALENARLYAQAERVATLEERQRIAAEMHDGLGQTLSFLGLLIDQSDEMVASGQHALALEQLERAREIIHQATGQVRAGISSLMEASALKKSLQDELDSLAAKFADQGSAALDLTIPALQPVLLPQERLDQIVRVAQEALTNAQRHARAERITMSLERLGDELHLMIQDDGIGFDLSRAKDDGEGHFGLPIMRARAAHLGGRLTLTSSPQEGTRVILSWPVSPHLEPERESHAPNSSSPG